MKLPRLLFLPVALLLAFFLPGLPQTTKTQTTKKSTAPSKSAPKSVAKAPTKNKKKTTSARAYPRRVTQQQPDEARTREIQEALAAKGYPVDASGVWGPQSAEALKKFQEDQNINNMSGRGKLDPLTLIALGLGPKREAAPAAASPADQAPTEGKKK